jgi:hypothetical protein
VKDASSPILQHLPSMLHPEAMAFGPRHVAESQNRSHGDGSRTCR